MALILSIETATPACSVALHRGSELLGSRHITIERSHSSLLTVLIEEVMQAAEVPYRNLDAIAVSRGPGSYTGLRIGVSVAKGLCFALDKPLLSVDTLKAMAHGVIKKQGDEQALYCPMIDARRMEVYSAVYDFRLQEQLPVTAVVVDAASYRDYIRKAPTFFFGDGSGKCREVLQQEQAVFLPDIHPDAVDIGVLAAEKYAAGAFEDTAYFEPYYLKEFLTKKPKSLL